MAAGLGKKRKLEYEWDVSEIQECSSGMVHGVVTQVTPVECQTYHCRLAISDDTFSNTYLEQQRERRKL